LTCIVAATFEDQCVIAADSLITSGYHAVKSNRKFQKLIQTEHFVIGIAGFYNALGVTQQLFRDKKYLSERHMKMRSQFHAIKLVQDIQSSLSKQIENLDLEAEDQKSFCLIAARSGIYRVDPNFSCTVSDTYDSIGSGEREAIGAMAILYDYVQDRQMSLDRAVHKAVSAAIENNIGCGGEIHLLEVGGNG
jgi:20S proteasome alpha/beta subunit